MRGGNREPEESVVNLHNGGGALAAHLDFAERRLDGLDPVADPSRLVPHVPTPKADDLKPFLDGWSPHGPDSSRW